MADNRVIIYVVSENKTKAGFDQAKADAEKAGDDAGKGFMDKFASWLVGGQAKWGGGGIGGILSTFTSAGLPGIAALAAGASALLVELDGLVSGFTAAAAGAGAFAALALPAFRILQANYTQLVQNQNDFSAASQNIATAIASSAKDAAQYQRTIADPEFRRAVLLLNDQNTVWQNLTASQQNSLVALDNNKAMLKTLLPAQQAALSILMKEQDAWNNLTPSQQAAAGGLDNIRTAYNKMSLAFQPVAFKLFGEALQVVADLMPKLLPLANAFAGALGPLLVKLDGFVKSKGFQDWFKQFLSIVGPATTAIGTGLGQVVIAFGKLLTIMSSKDVVNAIKIAFDLLAGTLLKLAEYIQIAMKAWDWFWRNIKEAISGAKHSFGQLADAFKWAFNGITDWFFRMGADIIFGLIRGIEHAAPGLLDVVGRLASDVGRAFGHLLGINSPSTVFAEHGRQIVAGLVQGIDSSTGRATAAVGRLAGAAGGGFGAGAGGGGGSQLVMNWGSPQTQALVKALWPNLQLEVRARGGGGPKSAQIALGQSH